MDEKMLLNQLRQLNPQAIILFGSAASGQRTQDSDFDVLIVQNTSKSFSERIREVHSRLKTNIPVDVIVLTPKEAQELPKKSSFFSQVFQEGKLLYGRI